MLGIVRAKMASKKVTNVEPVLSTIKDIKLPPDSIDCVLIVDAYHEFSHPREMAQSIFNALREKGRLILIEYRMEDPSVPDQVAAQNDAETSDRGNLTSRLCLEEDPRHSAPTAFHDFRKTGCRKKTFQVK